MLGPRRLGREAERMSVADISTNLARLTQTSPRQAAHGAADALESDLGAQSSSALNQHQAPLRGEGHRGEDTTGQHARDGRGFPPSRADVAFPGVHYPSPSPQMPAPLVPVRELPRGDVAVDSATSKLLEDASEVTSAGQAEDLAEASSNRFDEAQLQETDLADEAVPQSLRNRDEVEAEVVRAAQQGESNALREQTKVDPELAGAIFEAEA